MKGNYSNPGYKARLQNTASNCLYFNMLEKEIEKNSKINGAVIAVEIHNNPD